MATGNYDSNKPLYKISDVVYFKHFIRDLVDPSRNGNGNYFQGTIIGADKINGDNQWTYYINYYHSKDKENVIGFVESEYIIGKL